MREENQKRGVEMAKFKLAKRKIHAISNGIFLMGIALLIVTAWWWPGILLVLWATLATRQYLADRTFDLVVTTIILVGLTVVNLFPWGWNVMMPILFLLGGIYIIFREFLYGEDSNGEEKSVEIEEDADTES